MTANHDKDFDQRLLDLHLGHLSQAEQEELRARIAADPDLASQDAALASLFTALRTAAQDRAPAGLADKIKARIAAAGPPPRVTQPDTTDAQPTPDDAKEPLRLLQLGSLRDLVAVAAVIVLAIGVGVPSLLHMRERSQRMVCSSNLQSIGQGMQQYASAFNASLPFAGWGPKYAWQPTSDPTITAVPNRRHIYPLLRTLIIQDPQVFVCPSQRGVPMPRDAVILHNDFLEGRNVSYAYQNMAGVRPSPERDDPDMPILADENPLFDNGMPIFDLRRFTWNDVKDRNSPAHDGAGQNVLTLRGNVRWVTTPEAGVNGDNIWVLNEVSEYTGREGPAAATDSHLLK
jgi:hypothetical protein